jgi:crotonobetainyl-CoA:carnitine CoA-transferase CaiB-like acyl-CoA transferase
VLTIDEVFSDPQVLHLDMLVNVKHPELGVFRLPGIPVKLKATPGSIRIPAARLGEHTARIMQELGYTHEEIKSLYNNGVL